MRQIEDAELIKILAAKPKKQFIDTYNDVKNYERPENMITGVCGYVGDTGELIVHIKYQLCLDHHRFFIVDPQRKAMDFLKSLTDEIAECRDGFRIFCEDKSYFEDPQFTALYGEHDIEHSVLYGMFEKKPYKRANEDLVIRRLTEDDEEIINDFEKVEDKYTMNLRTMYRLYLKTGNPNHAVYGGFLDGQLVSFLYANTYDGNYWNIGYIFTLESFRGRGIAADLANYYGVCVTDSGAFASYGNAVNESSVRTALKAGFEKFDEWNYVIIKDEGDNKEGEKQ